MTLKYGSFFFCRFLERNPLFEKSLAKTLPNVTIKLGGYFKSHVPSMGTISLLQWEKGDHEVVDEVFSEKLGKNFTSRPHKI